MLLVVQQISRLILSYKTETPRSSNSPHPHPIPWPLLLFSVSKIWPQSWATSSRTTRLRSKELILRWFCHCASLLGLTLPGWHPLCGCRKSHTSQNFHKSLSEPKLTAEPGNRILKRSGEGQLCGFFHTFGIKEGRWHEGGRKQGERSLFGIQDYKICAPLKVVEFPRGITQRHKMLT